MKKLCEHEGRFGHDEISKTHQFDPLWLSPMGFVEVTFLILAHTGHFRREPSLIAGTMWTRLSTLARWDIVNKICILSASKTKVQMWVYWTQVWSLLCLVCNCYLQLILTHKDVFNSSIALTGEHLFKEQRRNLFWSKLLKSIEYNWTSSFMEYQKWRSRPCSNAK